MLAKTYQAYESEDTNAYRIGIRAGIAYAFEKKYRDYPVGELSVTPMLFDIIILDERTHKENWSVSVMGAGAGLFGPEATAAMRAKAYPDIMRMIKEIEADIFATAGNKIRVKFKIGWSGWRYPAIKREAIGDRMYISYNYTVPKNTQPGQRLYEVAKIGTHDVLVDELDGDPHDRIRRFFPDRQHRYEKPEFLLFPVP